MDCYNKLISVKKFTDNVGKIYGTEDFAIYLYSMIKMTKPKNILELGTGVGTTTLWSALALEENNQGTIYTIDDGSEWASFKDSANLFAEFYHSDYKIYIDNLIKTFQFQNYVQFYNQKISKIFIKDIDILFCDFSHGPYSIIKLLTDYLPLMNENSLIFIDSASTYYSSFLTLEQIITHLNNSKIPKTVFEMIDINDIEKFKEKVFNSKFELTHIIENKKRNQNSTAQIKIVPIDIMPQPRINVRF